MKIAIYHPAPAVVAEYATLITAAHPELDVSCASTAEDLLPFIDQVEALICFNPPYEPIAVAGKLKWIHYMSAGVDALMPMREHLTNVTVTNFAGRPSVADYAMGAVLMMHWNFRKLAHDQDAAIWDPYKTAPLEESTIGIIGMGSIGQDIARRANGFGMTVLGMRRRPNPIEGVVKMYGQDELPEMLPLCDFVVLTLPGTDETQKFIGKDQFAMMKHSAKLVNVGRGDILDQDALIEALDQDVIAGAALDVFEQEPLSKDSPIWGMKNVIISPHIAGATTRYVERVVERFSEALEHYRADQPMPHTVNIDLGY